MITRRLLLPLFLLVALPLLADRRANVERGLLLSVPIEGEPGMSLQDRMRHHGVPGLSVAVWRNGKIDWTAGYGNVKANTLLQAGTISNSLAAVATMRVLAKHRIPLDAEINAHLRGWKLPNGDGVTIAKILSHKAGLNVPGFPGFERGDPIPTLIDELEGRGNTQPLRVSGETRQSAGGYLLLQQLLIDLEKKPIEDILAAEVLRPAKMRDSTFAQPLPATLMARAASGITEDGDVPGGSYIFPEKTAAGLWTTVADLARFVIALQNKKLLSPALTRRMLDENLGVLPYRKHYFAQAGGNNGFFALYVATREGRDGAVLLASSEDAEPLIHEILRAVAKEYRWPEYAPRPIRLATNVDPEKVVGRYAFDRDDAVTVRPVSGRLVAKRTAQPDAFLDPLSELEYVNRETGELYIFRGDAVKVGDAIATRTRTSVPTELAILDVGVAVEEYKQGPPELRTEERLRKRGLWLLKQGHTNSAVQILKLNVEKHPESAAAHDALATAQLAAGDIAAARASSQKVLEKLATDWTPTASWRQVYRKRAERRLRDGTPR